MLRALRSISLLRSLRVIVAALAQTVKSTFIDIVVLMFISLFLFAVIGVNTFGPNTFAELSTGVVEFRNLGMSLLTQLQFVTASSLFFSII